MTTESSSVLTQDRPAEPANSAAAIRPFTYMAPQAELLELRRRIIETRWPDRETVNDDTQGVQLATMRALAKHWAGDYDWRKCEARLNSVPNFITQIDGVDIHFLHIRSKHKNALPLIVTHGWPGSILEQMKIIGPLTDPTAHGGKVEDAFHVVIPSIPGYGFSGKPAVAGWGPDRIASAWALLMQRLGYSHYVAQGGDWGALITELMAVQGAPGLIGLHTNMPGAVPPEIDKLAFAGAPAPAGLTAEEKRAYDRLVFFYTKGLAYADEMAKRPQTLYGIEDSPIGHAAWMLDHDALSYQMIARAFSGVREGLTPDDVLDNITLFWLTKTAVSAARLYWENKHAFFAPKDLKLPVAVSCFPDELYPCPRSWAEKAFSNLVHYNRLEKGGHFAAWEQPDLFCGELRQAFRTLRNA